MPPPSKSSRQAKSQCSRRNQGFGPINWADGPFEDRLDPDYVPESDDDSLSLSDDQLKELSFAMADQHDELLKSDLDSSDEEASDWEEHAAHVSLLEMENQGMVMMYFILCDLLYVSQMPI